MEKSKQEAKQEALSLKRKILTISNEIRLGKDGKNKFANYSYFTPDSINAELTPLLVKHGVFSHFNLEKRERTYFATLELSDADTSETITYTLESPELEIKGANPIQSLGGLQTYLKRYMLMNAFNIADNKDDFDSNEQNSTKHNITKKQYTEKNELLKDGGNGELIEKINSFKTEQDLRNFYNEQTEEIQKRYRPVFDNRKAELLKSEKINKANSMAKGENNA